MKKKKKKKKERKKGKEIETNVEKCNSRTKINSKVDTNCIFLR